MDQRNSFSPSPLRVSEEISNASFPNRRATIVFDFITEIGSKTPSL